MRFHVRRDGASLFSKADWHSVSTAQLEKLRQEVENLGEDHLLGSSMESLEDYFYEKYKIDVPVLQASNDDIVVEHSEVDIDVSGDPMRGAYYRHGGDHPHYVKGNLLTVSVPFTGESEAFGIQPTTYTLYGPEVKIQSNALSFQIQGVDLSGDAVKKQISQNIKFIESNLQNLRNDVQGLNSRLKATARDILERRRSKILANKNLLSSLGFKVKERTDVAKTYSAPEVRRKITPSLPPVSGKAFKPEPMLSDDDYDHVLGVMQNMATVMERSPSAFQTMGEEALRSHFLVQLNGHYEGQATGETFNYNGKTDILIRSDGKNIFIGECKFWSGQEKFLETINQLLTYTSWRDTKVAVIVFNRNKNFSQVLQTIENSTKTHPNCKKYIGKRSETSFRFTFSQPSDPSREMILTVMAFDVPTT